MKKTAPVGHSRQIREAKMELIGSGPWATAEELESSFASSEMAPCDVWDQVRDSPDGEVGMSPCRHIPKFELPR